MIDTFSTKKKKPKEISPPALPLEVKWSVPHAASCAQRCAQCGEDTYQYLNHHLPCLFLHNL